MVNLARQAATPPSDSIQERFEALRVAHEHRHPKIQIEIARAFLLGAASGVQLRADRNQDDLLWLTARMADYG